MKISATPIHNQTISLKHFNCKMFNIGSHGTPFRVAGYTA